jgi:hypothetical protein
MRFVTLTVAGLLLSAAAAHAQAPEASPAATPAVAPPAEGTVAPAAGDPGAPAPEALPAVEATPPAMIEESIDPALLGGGGDGALSAEELEKLGFSGAAPSVDTDIKVFGFADFTFAVAPMKKSNVWRSAVQAHPSFYIGNFKLYLTKNLSENVRFMSEVRFHYAPHGAPKADGSYTVNAAGDPADFNRDVHWGGVEIERIYVEWNIHPYLTMRAGQFLTPYGIWNVDHGSPLFIPVTRPYVIGSSLFPERQTGFEFLGKYDVSNDSAIGYHFTLSNGLGPVSEIRDLDDNKGVGGRLFWEYRGAGTLRIGGSAFYAKDTALTPTRGLDAEGHLKYGETITSQSKVLSLAADLQWKYKGLHVQTEVITQQRNFQDGGRVAATNPFTGTPIFAEDYLTWGVYGLIGYGIDVSWLGNVMPYAMIQSFDEVPATFVRTKTNGFSVGLNVRPIDAVVVKLAYMQARWPEGSLISSDPLHFIQAQIAWAF